MTFPAECHKSPFPRTIGYTMFETTATPAGWTRSMNLCRRLLTPCQSNVEAFRNRGVTVPIDVAPLGVNPEAWSFCDRAGRDAPFTFLMAGGLTHRKNPLGAVTAFLAAFPDQSDVRLVLKTRGGPTDSGFHWWAKHIPADERIQVIAENATPFQMAQYFAASDAFIWPSRGEGFGLPPLAGMATGLPVIVSDNSGMSQYCDDRFNYPIPCREVKVPPARDGGYPQEWGDCGNWWEPDLDAVVASMCEVYSRHTRRASERLAGCVTNGLWRIRARRSSKWFVMTRENRGWNGKSQCSS
jgi:glycosyltransferase involved in cell wall biosynthesis